MTLNEIASRLGGEIRGDGAVTVSGIATLQSAKAGDIVFLANPQYRSQLKDTHASAAIVAPVDQAATDLPRIVCDNPYAYFARLAEIFSTPAEPVAGIHATAVIDATASIAASASIGPLAYVGPGASIGEHVMIHPHVHIGAGVQLGERSVLYAHSIVYAHCVIGDRVIIHAGAVIGADGFGFAFDVDHWRKVPQVGRVVIGDDVEIGANSTIDRGAINDTVIEAGVKLDNQIQIGHNVRIGAHTAIAGCAGIAGSATVGRYCRIGGRVGIVGHVEICDGVTIMAQTLVTKSILAPGVYSGALHHAPQREWLKTSAHLRRLGQLVQRIAALEKQIEELQGRKT